MKFEDKGFLLSKNKYNENSAIAEFFTENNGKVSGIPTEGGLGSASYSSATTRPFYIIVIGSGENVDFVKRKDFFIKTDPENKPEKLYDIRSVDVRLTFRSSSKQGYFKKNIERVVKAFEAIGTFNIADNFLRDSVFVTVHTRNIGGMF